MGASPLRAGLVACTGDRLQIRRRPHQGHAPKSRRFSKRPAPVDTPINIHLTGCHHSCAQHYIGDIGLMAARVPVGEDDEPVEGYTIVVGGGFAERAPSAASFGATSRPTPAPQDRRACCAPISPIAPVRTKVSRPSPARRRAANSLAKPSRRRCHEQSRRRACSIFRRSAPFSPEQQAWLNGFFAGSLSTDGAPAPLCRRAERRACPVAAAGRRWRSAVARSVAADRRAHDDG